MKAPTTITLAGQTWTIKPLRLKTIRDLDLARTGDIPTDTKEREAYFFDMYAQVVAIGLSEDHPEMTLEAVYELRTDLSELVAAQSAILKLSGLVVEKDPQPGAPVAE